MRAVNLPRFFWFFPAFIHNNRCRGGGFPTFTLISQIYLFPLIPFSGQRSLLERSPGSPPTCGPLKAASFATTSNVPFFSAFFVGTWPFLFDSPSPLGARGLRNRKTDFTPLQSGRPIGFLVYPVVFCSIPCNLFLARWNVKILSAPVVSAQWFVGRPFCDPNHHGAVPFFFPFLTALSLLVAVCGLFQPNRHPSLTRKGFCFFSSNMPLFPQHRFCSGPSPFFPRPPFCRPASALFTVSPLFNCDRVHAFFLPSLRIGQRKHFPRVTPFGCWGSE